MFGPGMWQFKPFEDGPTFYTEKPPCRFHRFMQWLAFGFRWSRS